jgi:hypothetical protein
MEISTGSWQNSVYEGSNNISVPIGIQKLQLSGTAEEEL